MRTTSKATIKKVSSLSTLLSYLCVDLLSDEKFSILRELDSDEYSKIIDIAYEPEFLEIENVNKISFKKIIEQTLQEMTDAEIMLVFNEIYFPFEDAENPKFVKELFTALQNRYEWL